MKFFHHSADDVGIWIDRCHFEAAHGRVRLALERHRELANEFPEDPHVVYDEGIIRRDYLGQGLTARDLFEESYELASKLNKKGTRWFAASNAAGLARSEREFRKWASITLSLAPKGHSDHESLAIWLGELDIGVPHQALLLTTCQAFDDQDSLGFSAALAEVILHIGGMPPHEEVSLRRIRAEKLRGLDRIAKRQRETLSEAFLPEDRLALHEALAELENAITLDPYDPILWNLRSAWCNILGRYSESIESADRAIQLRPHRYSRPWINKASSLWYMNQDKEALECAREALKQAEDSDGEFHDDISLARDCIRRFSVPRRTPTLEELQPLISGILHAARIVCDEELGRGNVKIDRLVNGVLARARAIGRVQSISYVPMMAQLLSDFSAETAFILITKCQLRDMEMYRRCLYAAQYLAAHSERVQQRDAARFLVLNLFLRVLDSAELIRRTYREAILEVSAVATGPLANVDAILREELGHLHPPFPQLIACQEPLSEAERERGRFTISANFIGDPHEFEISMRHMKGYEWASAFDHPVKAWWRRVLGMIHRLWIEIRGAYPVLAEPKNQLEGERIRPSLQCEVCSRRMQKLDTGKGYVMVTREEAMTGVGTAEECQECSNLWC